MDQLVALDYSPWSEKARWSLDFVAYPYRERAYQPLFGALLLKAQTGQWQKKATVPVLLTEKGAFCDSFEIAKHAATSFPEKNLMPDGFAAELELWNQRAERLANVGREMILKRIMQDPAAQKDYIPKLPPPLKQLLGPSLARIGLAFFKKKYAINLDRYDENLKVMDEVLSAMASALSGQDFLLGSFSYADIAMAAVLQFVKPVDVRFIPLKGASRVRWETPEMIAKYPALLRWRDQLYENKRSKNLRHSPI